MRIALPLINRRGALQRLGEAVRGGQDPAGVSFDPAAPAVRFEAGNYLIRGAT